MSGRPLGTIGAVASGKSREQLLTVAHGTFYVVAECDLPALQELALALHREDVRVVGPEWLVMEECRKAPYPLRVVTDHGLDFRALTRPQQEVLWIVRSWSR